QRAIATGDTETGVTIMKMAAGLDTGDMMYKTLCPISAEDTSASLHDKLALQGAEAIVAVLESEQTLQHYLETREVQAERLTVYAHKLTKAEAQVDWAPPAAHIDRVIRAFDPSPLAFAPLDDSSTLRIWNSSLTTQNASNALPGEVIALNDGGVHVMCGV